MLPAKWTSDIVAKPYAYLESLHTPGAVVVLLLQVLACKALMGTDNASVSGHAHLLHGRRQLCECLPSCLQCPGSLSHLVTPPLLLLQTEMSGTSLSDAVLCGINGSNKVASAFLKISGWQAGLSQANLAN